jgi:DNA mismatch repair protein MutL
MQAPHFSLAGKVRLLDAHTINQIAAGEVVERPASVVKELVENAIDAGATRIVVELEDSGCKLIRVCDNGCGMSQADLLTALERHATSKIRSTDDLQQVTTLGFRGEAMPSIASVSVMTIASAEADGMRTVVRIEGGEQTLLTHEPGPKGTDIRVEDLFYNTPARLKFLKSATTELGQCLEVLSRYALAHPDVSFHVTHNGQTAMSTDGAGDMLLAIGGIWSRDAARALVEVDAEIAGIRVRGFASPPHFTKPTRSMQFIFVNGRPVRSKTLSAAIDQAYRSLTPEKRYPVVILMLEIEPSRIDINVSPTKSEIKFQQEGAAFDAVRYALKQALLDSGMMPSAEAIAAVNEALQQSQPNFGFSTANFQTVPLGVSDFAQRNAEFISPVESGPLAEANATGVQPFPAASADASRYPFADLLDGLHVIGQAMNTFIIAENRRGLVVIDQHVAHERVIYEYLCGLKGPTAIEIQRLLVPETLHLDKRSAVMLAERIDTIREVGFDIEPFGADTFVVRAAPAALRGKSPLKVLQDLVDELVDAAVTRKLVPTREAIWIMSSCKMAVKAGDPLSHAEMEKLIADLAMTENPYLCPHGRPITLTLSADELLRKFKRM